MISVVVPVYNVPVALLRPCLEALACQTVRSYEYEVVIVDDCSTNHGTKAFVEEFVARCAHFKLIQHARNSGLNEARRTGRHAASGSHILFVDGDDILTRDAVETLRMHAHQSRADIVTCCFARWSPEDVGMRTLEISDRPFASGYEDRIRDLSQGKHSFTMCGRLFRADVIPDEVFNIPEGLLHEDVATCVHIMYRTRTVDHVHKVLYLYTDNRESITRNFSLKHAEDLFWVFHHWIELAKEHQLLGKLWKSVPEIADRFVLLHVGRCLSSEAMADADKASILRRINELYDEFPLKGFHRKDSRLKAFLTKLAADESIDATWLCRELALDFKLGTVRYAGAADFPITLQPSEMAARLLGKVVFICQVDYQLRNAATFARLLHKYEIPCAVLDNSQFASGGSRTLNALDNELFDGLERIQVLSSPYPVDWLATARLVLMFNDFNEDFRTALEFRNRLELPSVSIVEGINDFLRIDFEPYRYLPYRRCKHVFLTGEADCEYFRDRETAIIGLPIIETLSNKVPIFPERLIAAINVNFTYGAQEWHRARFLSEATEACQQAGVDYVITQHPADTGDLSDYPVSRCTQYEVIDSTSVFISRFATGILEALASGKPAIYFNPHGEKCPKFHHPHGAFEIATTRDELMKSIHSIVTDIKLGVDFRERARPFLRRHTHLQVGDTAANRLGRETRSLLESSRYQFERVNRLFFERLKPNEEVHCNLRTVRNAEAPECPAPYLVTAIPELSASYCATLDEVGVAAQVLGKGERVNLSESSARSPGIQSHHSAEWSVQRIVGAKESLASVVRPETLLVVDSYQHVSELLALLDVEGRPAAVVLNLGESHCDVSDRRQLLIQRAADAGYTLFASSYHSCDRATGERFWHSMRRVDSVNTCDHQPFVVIAFRETPEDAVLEQAVRYNLRFSPTAAPISRANGQADVEVAPTKRAGDYSPIRTWELPNFFDGACQARVANLHIPGDHYIIEFCFIPHADSVDDKFTDTSPPSPFLAKPFAIYQRQSGRYEIRIQDNNSVILNFQAKPGAATIVHIDVDRISNETTVFVNDGFLGHVADFAPQIQSLSIGKGYKNRYWVGKVVSCAVWLVDKTEFTAEPSNGRYRHRLTRSPLVFFDGFNLRSPEGFKETSAEALASHNSRDSVHGLNVV